MMRSRWSTLWILVAIVALVAGLAPAVLAGDAQHSSTQQKSQAAKATAGQKATEASAKGHAKLPEPAVLYGSKLIGQTVKNSKGEALGKVDDVVLSPDCRWVSYLALTAGAAKSPKRVAVPFEAFNISSSGRKVTAVELDIPKKAIDQAQGFKEDAWPAMGNLALLPPGPQAPADSSNWKPGPAPAADQQGFWVRRLTKLTGLDVRDQSGGDVGSLEDLAIEQAQARPIFAIVSLDQLAKVKNEMAAVPWDSVSIELQPKQVALVDAPASTLESLAFKESQWPDLASRTGADDIYQAFNAQPYWQTYGYAGEPPAYTRQFQKGEMTTVTGTVESVGTFRRAGCEGQRLRLKTDGGESVVVHTCAAGHPLAEEMQFASGDKITVTGSKTEVGGHEVIMASEVTKGPRTWRLRSESGMPYREGMPKQHMGPGMGPGMMQQHMQPGMPQHMQQHGQQGMQQSQGRTQPKQAAADQPQAGGQTPSATQPAAPPEIVMANQLIGAGVWNLQDHKLGTIEDVVLDTMRYRIAYAVLSYPGSSAQQDKLFAVPWSALQIKTPSAEGEVPTVWLDISRQKLASAPGFPRDRWPNFANPTFLESLSNFYGAIQRYASTGARSPAQQQRFATRRLTDLIGRTVKNEQDTTLGYIEDVAINDQTGRPVFAVLGVAGEDKLSDVPWDLVQFSPTEEVARLDETRQTVDALAYNPETPPDLTSPAYQARVFQQYGRTPYWQTYGYAGESRYQPWEEGSRFNLKFDPNQVKTYKGTVESVGSFRPAAGASPGQRLRIRTDDGKHLVIFGAPLWFAQNLGMRFYHGDQVTVKGAEATVDGQSVILPSVIKTATDTWMLRDDAGRPVWADVIPGQNARQPAYTGNEPTNEVRPIYGGVYGPETPY